MQHQVTAAADADLSAVLAALEAIAPGYVTQPYPRTPRIIHVQAPTEAESQIMAVEGVIGCCSGDHPVELFITQELTPAQWANGAISGTPGQYVYDRDGDGVRIFIVDTGTDVALPEFGGRASVIHDPQASGPGDHGTITAACAAGAVYGTAKGATILNAVGFNADGSGATTVRINGALDAVANWIEDNPSSYPAIVSMSFGASGFLLQNPFTAAIDRLRDLGAIMVAASGNGDGTTGYDVGGSTNNWPSEDPDVVSVGAHDSLFARGNFSNYPADIYAPGVDCEAIGVGGAILYPVSGTSLSCPHLAGAIACVLQAGGADPVGFLLSGGDLVSGVPNGPSTAAHKPGVLSFAGAPVPAGEVDEYIGGDAQSNDWIFSVTGGDALSKYHPSDLYGEAE